MFKKILNELNRVREISIDFVSYETDEEENSRLLQELAIRKDEIRTKNYLSLMRERLIPFVIDEELARTGLTLKKEDAIIRAHRAFCQAKKDGKLDDLNNIVSEIR